jgi:hypothetical protein
MGRYMTNFGSLPCWSSVAHATSGVSFMTTIGSALSAKPICDCLLHHDKSGKHRSSQLTCPLEPLLSRSTRSIPA